MLERLKKIYNDSTLAIKIRYFYLILLIPLLAILVYCFYNLWKVNENYRNMIQSASVASQFNLDFKKDFDLEAYLLVVENKTIEESNMDEMLSEANRIVDGLEELTNRSENNQRLNYIKKYIYNLETYSERIKQNLIEGNKYQENIEIWEKDVQIVSSLIQDTVFEYVFYEIRDIQQSHNTYQKTFVDMIRFSVLVCVGIFILILFLSYYIPKSLTQPIRELTEATDQVAKGDLTVQFNVRSGVEASKLSVSLNSMIDKINELLVQITKEQRQLRKAEFELLQSQINPHFLYNTLDAIVWLAESGEQRGVINMVGSLSEFFRTSLNQGKDIITIGEELQHVRSYLEIQQVRYQDILKYEILIPVELEKYLIPKITIQPLVENALYHGIKNKRGYGRIRISGKADENNFVLQIEDNGIGIREDHLTKLQEGLRNRVLTGTNSFGLYNVNERIRLNFGDGFGILIESIYNEKTVVSIVLPYVQEK